MKEAINFLFFGTSHIAVYVLEELQKAALMPSLVVTMPDRIRGRGLKSAASPVKLWALEQGAECIEPEVLDEHFAMNLKVREPEVCVVCDYGKILQREILAIPRKGFLNVHPSLLPRLRGASPIRSAILNDERDTGVTIIVLDEKMDHGPILAQKRITPQKWPVKNSQLESLLMQAGGALLAQILPEYVAGNIEPREQNHDVATYAGKFSKEDGKLDLGDNAYKNLLKICAFEGWPGTYANFSRSGRQIRVQILDAHLEGNSLVVDRVKPEGKKEMSYEEFLRSGARLP